MFHLVGIAGNGMRALADVLAAWGWPLSGSDLNPTPVQSLADVGVRLFEGHAAENLAPDTEWVVFSDAVPPDNPEIRRAAELGIPALSYFQLLGRLSEGRRTVAVAGTHGKSTTTAITAHLLIRAGLDPTVFCGATPLGATSGGRAGQGSGVRVQGLGGEQRAEAVASGQWPVVGEQGSRPKVQGSRNVAENANCLLSDSEPLATSHWPLATISSPQSLAPSPSFNSLLLVEACEYRANFLHLHPWNAAILGIEPDHFDCYDSLASLENAFRRFAESLPDDGFLLARHDCESTRRITAGLKCRVETFGLDAQADWSAVGLEEELGRFRFRIERQGRPFCEVRLQTPGRHNVLNALAAAALAFENGVSAEQISAGLGDFPGLHRRMERLADWGGAMVIDDYAHHPTEVTAALATVRLMRPHSRVWCVFQPHQASRTARLLDELAESLQNADKLLVGEIYRAREGEPQPGEATAADLARRTAELGVEVLPGRSAAEIVETLETQLAPGDVLVTLGAGDVEKFRG